MANTPIGALTAVWNNAGTVFNAIKMSVTNTASAAGSKLLNLLVGGVSKFSVDVSGNVVVGGNITLPGSGNNVINLPEVISGQIEVPVEGAVYYLCIRWPYSGTVTLTTTFLQSGSCTVAFGTGAGVMAGGSHAATARSITSSVTAVAPGSVIYLGTTSVNAALRLSYAVTIVRS
jgi:hypothetical protein